MRRSSSLATPQPKTVDTVREKEVVSNVQEGCPITGLTGASSKNFLKLFKVLSLPFRMIRDYSSRFPRLDWLDAYSFHTKYRKRFGNCYILDLPGLGSGLHGNFHVTTDLEETVKMVQRERSYSAGVTVNLWILREIPEDSDNPLPEGNVYGLLTTDYSGSVIIHFFRTGMLDPRAAKWPVPDIQETSRITSPKTPA
jgi:hypothetical protein